MGEIILYIWECLQISPKDSHFPDTFLKYLTTKKYIVWNMAFLWTNLRVRYFFFSLRYIGMTEYWNSIILDFNQSYLLKNGSKQKKIQEMAIKMPLNIVFLGSPNVRIILTSLCRDIMFIGSRPYAQTLYVFQRSCLVSFGIFQICNKI